VSACTAAAGDRGQGDTFRRCVLLLLACSLCLPGLPASARDTHITDTRSLLVDGVYRIGARVEFDLDVIAEEALENGVPLVLEVRIEVLHERDWLWPDVVAELRQRFELQYRALSRRYVVHNFSSGVRYSFREFSDALQFVGNIYDLPLIDANLLEPGQSYWVSMRADLDIESLPTPIRLWAYLGSNWSLHSDWTRWRLEP